jgi:hypothetical protein
MNARKTRIIRRMTKAKYGNGFYRHAKRAYSRQPHNKKDAAAAFRTAASELFTRRRK